MENLTSSEICWIWGGCSPAVRHHRCPKSRCLHLSLSEELFGYVQEMWRPCSQCKGVGSVRKGGPFSFSMLEEIFESPGDGSTPKELIPYMKCCSKGRFPCSNCIRLPRSLILQYAECMIAAQLDPTPRSPLQTLIWMKRYASGQHSTLLSLRSFIHLRQDIYHKDKGTERTKKK